MHSRPPPYPPPEGEGNREGIRGLNSFGRRNDEQAREEARRAGRATANATVAPEAGRPAWPAVARQAGQSARAQADHLADAARTERPLTANVRQKDGAPSDCWGAVLFLVEVLKAIRF